MIPNVNVVTLNGDALERGIQHGQQCRKALSKFADDGLCRLNHLGQSALSLSQLGENIERYRICVKTWLPDIAQEIEGLSIGAEMPLDLAWLLQLRREVLGYNSTTESGDCTTLSSFKGQSILAQTVDLNGNLDDFIHILECKGTRNSSLILSFAGLLGYLGLNRAGLAIGLNMVLGGTWGVGIPPYLVIRHLLDNYDTVEQAVKALRCLPLSSSRSFTLCDKQHLLCVEILNNQLRIVEAGYSTAHTNHFLHPDFASHDQINIFAKNSSRQRLEKTRELLQQEHIDSDDCFSLFTTPPVCVADNGDIRRERTVAAVVILPEEGKMLLRPGNPALSTTQSFSLFN
ncbi:hypothetical protein KKI93_17555 [Xenorhabdus bovienii]|nr:C45 family peptidase [Xenorhabdus bovienii]MDE9565812.1 hypothetical protein [Xenorhabdus bovienii]